MAIKKTFKLIFAAVLIFISSCYADTDQLFPADVNKAQWIQFKAYGFSKPACAVVYDNTHKMSCGMPLGSVDTGCVDIETDGTFGFNIIYNSHVPRRGRAKMATPFLGLSIGEKSWVLSTIDINDVAKPTAINYWGHYPILDMEYELDAPVSVGVRSWAPFIVGDEAASNTPAAIFEVHLRNTTKSTQSGSIVLSFPGPTNGESGSSSYETSMINNELYTAKVIKGKNGELAIGAIGENPRFGGSLAVDNQKWANIHKQLPPAAEIDSSTSIAVDYELKPNESKIVRFVVAWYFPTWLGAGSNDIAEVGSWWGRPGSDSVFYHMFARRFNNAEDVVTFMVNNHESLLNRVIAWQEVLYSDQSIPVWLRESLANMLHLITECGMWAQAKPPIESWCKPEDGLFALNESPRDCPQMECIPCSFYGSQPLVYFFPKLAMSTMRGYINYMTYDGAAPWIFGGITARSEPDGARNFRHEPTAACAMHLPCRGYQTTTNGISFAAMADRIWMCSGYDKEVLNEIYPYVKKNTIYTMNLRTEDGPDGIVSMPTNNIGTEWFEHCQWFGITAHVGGLHLAQLRIAERMADQAGDKVFADLCRAWFAQGSEVMEQKMWTGSYYLNFFEPKTGKKSDLIFSYQMDGEWITDNHGLPFCFPKDRVTAALATIRKVNAPLSDIGALSFVNSDGSAAFGGEGALKTSYDPYAFFSAELLMLAMNYMYEGEKQLGLDWAKACMKSIVCDNLYTWDMPNMIRGDTGKIVYGRDYYQMLMLWGFPAAMKQQDLAGPMQKDGLVTKMINAANPK